MDEIKFTSRDGSCPRYKNYFIKDKFDGHIDGKDRYSYALFEDGDTEIKHFSTFKEANRYITKAIFDDDDSDFEDWYQYDNDELRAAIYDEKVYRIWKKTNTINIKQPNKQLTSWYSTYRECLKVAKEALEKLEHQYNIFDYYVPDPEKDNNITKTRR